MMLVLHIVGGVISLLMVASVSLAIMSGSRPSWARPALAVLAGWQNVTVILLVMAGGSLLRTCVAGLAYLSIMALVYNRVGEEVRSTGTYEA
jgi:hypothetical protein